MMTEILIGDKSNFKNLYTVLDKTFTIVRLSCDGKIIDANDRFLDLFHFRLDELTDESFWRLTNKSYTDMQEIWQTTQLGEQWMGELCLITKYGDLKWLESTFIPIVHKNGDIIQVLTLHLDKTDQKNVDQWKHFAFRHDLTKLPNRRALLSSVEDHICKADQNGTEFAVLFMDINQFKLVNDKYGHHTGDLLLIEVGKRLSQLPLLDGRLFHIGGDEFIILLDEMDDLDAVIESIFSLIEKGFQLEECRLQISVSIGVSQYPNHSVDAQRLLKLADHAMYEAKALSKNQYRLYGETIQC